MNANIQVVGTVVNKFHVNGTTKDGKKFQYERLIIKTQNGNHWEHVQPRKEADKTTLKVFATAKEGDAIQFDDCFVETFIHSGRACVAFLANKAQFAK